MKSEKLKGISLIKGRVPFASPTILRLSSSRQMTITKATLNDSASQHLQLTNEWPDRRPLVLPVKLKSNSRRALPFLRHPSIHPLVHRVGLSSSILTQVAGAPCAELGRAKEHLSSKLHHQQSKTIEECGPSSGWKISSSSFSLSLLHHPRFCAFKLEEQTN